MSDVSGKKVAIVVADNFEQVEMTEPRAALDEAGAKTVLISPAEGKVKGVHHDKPGDEFDVDVALEDARADDYDALLLPGGLMSPDELRMNRRAVALVEAFYAAGKPIFAICHGPWLLIEADITKDLTLTSWPAIKTDILNAGGNWVDKEVVTDKGVVTSRCPDDIPAFNAKMLEELAEGNHARLR